MFSRSCALHTIARIACKIEYTIYVVSKHISANIIFHQGGRPMSAPTDYTLLLLYKNYMYKHIKTGYGIIQNLGSSWCQTSALLFCTIN